MASVVSFIRNTPAETLRKYFKQNSIDLPHAVNWSAPEPQVVQSLLQAVDSMDDMALARVQNDIERVSSMADEAGETALYSVVEDRALLDSLRNAHDRALWLFLNDPPGFLRAEEVRFTDERRRGRTVEWLRWERKAVVGREVTRVDLGLKAER
ncbi:MAG: hypothetical protein BroJett024_39550 [Alphaproteobacteria bacterium]|nr:MAG: hypothetical protein BroJett024_39550 [Alphaproteobacteria bacterium]